MKDGKHTMVALGTASISVFFSMPTEILRQSPPAAAVGIISTMKIPPPPCRHICLHI